MNVVLDTCALLAVPARRASRRWRPGT